MKARHFFVLTAIAVLVLIAGAFWMHARTPPPALGRGVQLLEGERPLAAFRLESTAGPLTNAGLRGHWTFLLFGYTHCPDVCPTSLALLAAVTDRVRKTVSSPPQVVFVSVDAPRDSVEVLSRYVPAFHAGFVGATGNDAALKPFARDLGVYYVRNVEEGQVGGPNNDYSVDHTSSVFLIAPDGSLRAVFPMPQEAPQMATDTIAIMHLD